MPVELSSFSLNHQIASTTAGAPDQLLTQNNGVGQITMATVNNSSAGSVVVSVFVLPQSIAPAAVTPVWSQEIPAGRTAILAGLIGHTVPRNGSIRVMASLANVARISISGANYL